MDNTSVSQSLNEIATLLELKGENPFKTRAYSNAARIIESLSEPLSALIEEERLGELKGIGSALQDKIATLVAEGTLPYLEDLRASMPEGLLKMLEIPGLGPKKIKLVYDQLGVDSIDKLETACKDGSLAQLKGMGKKTAENILSGIEQARTYSRHHRYGDVIERAEDLVDTLRTHPDVVRISIAGSLRRSKEVIKDIDILASAKETSALMDAFTSLPGILRVINHGETKSSVLLEGGIQCDLRVVDDSQYPYALHHFTGSKEHNVAMRQRAIRQGMKLSEWGLFKTHEDGREDLIPCPDERTLFKTLDLDEIPPELRENLGEIEAAGEGSLPRLLEWTDLRGSLHNHTTASDGRNSLQEMAEAAASIGLEYLGISDHSKASVQANGLDETRLAEQIKQIRAYNQTRPECVLLAGIECDILKDGSLDLDDSILAKLDYVVASVHSSFTLPEKEMTRRIIRAMENPHVTVLGHPTGRLLLQREPYALDLSKIIDAAAETNTWIELNANPRRLDLDWRWWKQARDKGVRCVITPDAHRVEQLGYLKLGAQIARKGWLRKQDVVNTLPLSQFLKACRAHASYTDGS